MSVGDACPDVASFDDCAEDAHACEGDAVEADAGGELECLLVVKAERNSAACESS